MASVKIDLGSGEQAMLSQRAGARTSAVGQQRDADEFLRRWPQTRSIQQAQDYLRQLGLHVAYKPPGVNQSDTIALLRSAVKDGTVAVVIQRATTPFRGGAAAPREASPSGAIASSRQSFAEMTAGGSAGSTTLLDSASASPSYSWMQSYEDVSADDLINYVQGVIATVPGGAANLDAGPSSPLGDAAPLELGGNPIPDDLSTIAARGVSESDEAECFAQYERDLEMCNALGGPMGGARGLALCRQQAFMNYQQCRGY